MAQKLNLRPSSSKRWTTCPGSVSLIQRLIEEGVVSDDSSSYADEGSLAHALAAQAMGKEVPIEPEWEKHHSEEMEEYVAAYVSFCKADIPKSGKDYKLLVEHQTPIFYDANAPEGTADCVIVDFAGKHIYIKDLKYGMGVSVQAYENTQLVIYAMSVFADLLKLGVLEGPEEDWTFTLQIYQPRVIGEEAVRTWDCDFGELYNQAKTIKDAAETILNHHTEDLPFKASEDACRFCPAAPCCSSHAEFVFGELPLNPLQTDVKDMPKPTTLSPDQIARILAIKKPLTKYLNTVEAHAKDMLMDGKTVPNYHLVKTKKNATWKDEQKALAFMGKHFPKSLYAPASLVSPTVARKMLQMRTKEKKVRSSTFTALEDLIHRPESNPTIATYDDKREAYILTTAEQEFGEDASMLL